MASRSLIAASFTPIVLSLLSHGEAYGYDIIRRIEDLSDGTLKWSAGTMYPVLHRLESRGYIRSILRPSATGPERKYYSLTKKGHQALENEKRQWLDVHNVLIKLWGPQLQFG